MKHCGLPWVAGRAGTDDGDDVVVVTGKEDAAAGPLQSKVPGGHLECAKLEEVDVVAGENARPGTKAEVGARVEAESVEAGV